MRLWTIHPQHLDTAGLTALWRESLLAQKVLEGNTKGYKNHSQLIRFKDTNNALNQIRFYMHSIADEADARGYNYNRSLIGPCGVDSVSRMPVTEGQFAYEFKWLQQKLEKRNPNMFTANEKEGVVEIHPLFYIIDGDIEHWERV
jgi:hypothetical protein